jgi:CheY-like chemotaxis protein
VSTYLPGRKKLLIVEDNEDTARKLRALFKEVADTDIARDTDEAFLKMPSFHLALMDALMPTALDPTPRLEHTKELMDKLTKSGCKTALAACSREYNAELVKWGCKFALDFAGCDGKTDIPGFRQAVCILLDTCTFLGVESMPDGLPLA